MQQEKKEVPSNTEHHTKEIVSGGISAFATRLIGMGLNWVFAVMLARSTGAAGTGVYNLCQSLLNFSNSISKLGSDTIMTRFGVQYYVKRQWGLIKDLYNKSMMISIPLSLCISAIIYFFSDELIRENAELRNTPGKRIDKNKIKGLEEMLSTLTSKGTKVIVVMSPALAPFGMEPSYQAIEDVCTRYHVPFKDYSQDSNYLHLEYFFDNHMNKDGANLYSSRLANDIGNVFFPNALK